MREKTTYLLWGTGILTAVFGLSIGLSWWSFGYLDMVVVRHMVVLLTPVWVVTAGLLFWGDVEDARPAAKETRQPAQPRERVHA